MKVVLLAGGFGTRIFEESQFKPKPMIEVEGKPLLWYIMKQFASFGYDDFIICAGYKQEYIKKWFFDYFTFSSDVCFDYKNDRQMLSQINNKTEKWKVQIVDTGLTSNTGERIKLVKDLIGDEDFFISYGDCISDINIDSLIQKHNELSKILTITAINYPSTKGVILEQEGLVVDFREKERQDSSLINGGFMVASNKIFDCLEGNNPSLEVDAMRRILANKELACYIHDGNWACIDNMNDKLLFEKKLAEFKFNWKK